MQTTSGLNIYRPLGARVSTDCSNRMRSGFLDRVRTLNHGHLANHHLLLLGTGEVALGPFGRTLLLSFLRVFARDPG